MADLALVHTDLELFLTGWYRTMLASAEAEAIAAKLGAYVDLLVGVEVDNKEPAEPPFPAKLLVIRDDGGPQLDQFTAERQVGLTVLAGTRERPKDANDLIRVVMALAALLPAVDDRTPARNPVASLEDSNGPVPVAEEQDRARRFGSVTLIVTPY